MRYPFDRVEGGHRRVAAGLLLATVLAFVALSIVDRATRNELAPLGQVSLQLAGDGVAAAEIVSSWEADGVVYLAGASVGIDYVFMTAYGLALAFAGSRVADRARATNRVSWVALGGLAAWAGALAAVLDAVEGVLLLMLIGDPTSGPAAATRGIALTKFALLGVALSLIAAGLVAVRARGAAR